LATTPTIVIGFDAARSHAIARRGMAGLRRSYETGAQKIANSIRKIWKSAFDFRSHLALIHKAFYKLNSFFVSLFSQSFFHAIRETADQFLTFNNVVQSLTGSAAEAGEQFKFLADNSLRLGFDIDRTTTAYKKLFAAGKITGFQTKEVEDVFSSLSETAVVTGMTSYQLEGALKAVVQMMSKGRVQAEELRGQLGEHLPGAFELAAGAMNMTTNELEKNLIKGLISAKELLTELPKELRRVYGPALAKALRTPVREIERLKTTIRLYLKDIYEGVNELLFSIVRVGTSIATWIGTFFKAEWNDTLNYISAVLQASNQIFQNFKDMINALVGGPLKAAIDVIGKFSNFFMTTIGVIPDTITFLFKKAFLGIGPALGIALAAVLPVTKSFVNIMGSYFDILGQLISGSFAKALASIRLGLSDFLRDIFYGNNPVGTLGKRFYESVFGDVDKFIRGDAEKIFEEVEKVYTERLPKLRGQLKSELELMQNLFNAMAITYTDYVTTGGRTGEEWSKFLEKSKKAIDEMYKTITDFQNQEIIPPKFREQTPLLPPPEEIEKELKKIEKEVTDMWTRIGDSLSNSLTDAFGDFLETGKLDLSKWIKEVAIDINKIIFQELIAKQIGTSIAGSLRGMFGNAPRNTRFDMYTGGLDLTHGGAGGGGLDLSLGGGGGLDLTGAGMAKGGILNGPAVLAGEAGPEGILPLTRTSNGDLGVKASGGNVIINNYSGQEANASKDINGNTTVNIGKMVQEAVNTNIASGRHDRILKHRFQIGMRGV